MKKRNRATAMITAGAMPVVRANTGNNHPEIASIRPAKAQSVKKSARCTALPLRRLHTTSPPQFQRTKHRIAVCLSWRERKMATMMRVCKTSAVCAPTNLAYRHSFRRSRGAICQPFRERCNVRSDAPVFVTRDRQNEIGEKVRSVRRCASRRIPYLR